MSYEAALADLKQSFGDKKLLSPAEIAPYIGKSAAAQAKLRDRGHFPIKVRRDMGNKVVMSIYDVARYIGEPVEEPESHGDPSNRVEAPPRSRSAPRTSTVSAGQSLDKPFRRPPSLGKSIRVFGTQIAAAEATLELDKELYAALESMALDASTPKSRGGSQRSHRPKRLGL